MGQSLIPRPSWWDDALCRGMGVDLFFGPEPTAAETVAKRRQREAEAKRVCAGCHVSVECLADALAFNDEGVRGGLTRHERLRIAEPKPVIGGWVVIATSPKLGDETVIERRTPMMAALTDEYRVRRNNRIILTTTDEAQAWRTLHNHK